jgi:hypothetical protein
MNLFSERATNYGVVGDYLLSLRSLFPDAFSGYGTSTFVADLVRLQSSVNSLRSVHPLLPTAISLLALPFPLQIQLQPGDTLAIAKTAAGVPFNYVHGALFSDFLHDRGLDRHLASRLTGKTFLSTCFPVKNHAAARTKVNLALTDLCARLIALGHTRTLVGLVNLCAGRLHEDQFINLIVYGFGLSNHFGSVGWDIATYYVLYPDVAKAVSVSLKALGANSTREGALLVEADTLQGRLAKPIDLEAEALYRCDPADVAAKVIPYSEGLRQHIRHILKTELADRELVLPDINSWWSSRWLWCVNGSQTAASSRAMAIDPKRNRATHNQDYRRMASEALERNPVPDWDGYTNVSKSVKLENGKQRAIFACDTNSYFAFSWILSATEKLWRNSRVILDPGAGGLINIARRVKHAQRGGGVNLMLDYDDFNSHHSTEVMQCVFDELCDLFGAPDWYRDLLIRSFDDMHITIRGVLHRVVGTLMSGHRGTTFINTVLNAAYIRASIGGPAFDRILSLHAGDDVYIRANTLSDCESILYSAKKFGCRMNPAKQSIGFVGAEFLRLAIGPTEAYGYFARSVSGFVSGNWVTQDVLSVDDALVSMISGCRTLINRSGCARLPHLLAGALRYTRGLARRDLIKLLSGEAAIEGSPVYNSDGLIRNYRVTTATPDSIPIPSTWARNASRDYLTDHMSELEITAVQMAGVDALSLLVASSYSKGLNQDFKKLLTPPKLTRVKVRLARGVVSAATLVDKQLERGVLSGYPIIRLFENRLTVDQIRELVMLAGGDPNARDIREEAFGRTSISKNIIGILPFGDAATLSKRTTAGNIFTLYDVHS